MISDMARPKKEVKLSTREHLQRWREANPQRVKNSKERQRLKVKMKSHVNNLLIILEGTVKVLLIVTTCLKTIL